MITLLRLTLGDCIHARAQNTQRHPYVHNRRVHTCKCTDTQAHTHSKSKLPIVAYVAPLSEFRRCLCKVLMCKHSNRHMPECTYCISMPCLTSNRLHLNDTMGYEVTELHVFISKANLLFFIM